ncbi:MAG: Uma2 family endonuclease [Planctomycetes bacterium]|nr:Uma2 family endonuclease [Planctomycetota bacterium]
MDGALTGLPTRIQMAPAVPMTPEQFFEFCQQNPDKRFEQTAQGELIIMPPLGLDGGFQEGEVYWQLAKWAKAVGKGMAVSSNVAFILPNGANRAPDASWLSPEQMASLTDAQRKKFPPLCPFFLVEVRSPSDRLKELQDKMDEYIANGCQQGWLIDPDCRQVHVFRPGQPSQAHDNPQTVSGDPELPGFVLDLGPVWQP